MPSEMREREDRAVWVIGRVLRVSGADSLGVMVVAGLALVYCLVAGHFGVIPFCVVALGAGWIERAGRDRLAGGRGRAFPLLRVSQLVLLLTVCVYAVWRLMTWDAREILAVAESSPLAGALLDGLPDRDLLVPFLDLAIRVFYILLIVLSVVFQGGMWVYYRRAERIAGGLERAPAPPVVS